ncbi:hypothetical protein ACTWP4_00235 [Gracilibacillus sp. D59]|uniref:hypothetical protein n=1 Tax=Gracilibacillus sp. D59 TaxID=3457434 RepID=UPI003FCC8B33
MIKLKNKDLRIVSDFLLNSISAKGKKNIHRMRIVEAINEQRKKYAQEEELLLKDYCKLDEQGELKRNNQGTFDVVDKGKMKELADQREYLQNEVLIIDDKNLITAFKTVEKLVNEYDKELVGEQALAHFILSEAFENKEEKELKGGEN